jgi:hypothetical protein
LLESAALLLPHSLAKPPKLFFVHHISVLGSILKG